MIMKTGGKLNFALNRGIVKKIPLFVNVSNEPHWFSF